MTIEVTAAEAASSLCRVPVCIGCHRPATGRGRVRLHTKPSPGAAFGGAELIDAVVAVVAVVAAVAGRASMQSVEYPACWRHRWINRPTLSLADGRDGRIALGGVSAEFAAAWAYDVRKP